MFTDLEHYRRAETDLDGLRSPTEIPSAKKIASKQKGVHGWLRYYAGFSPSFVQGVASFLNLNSDSLVYDPFTGTGTTNIVCKALNIPSFGMELNPISYLVANAKLSCVNPSETIKELMLLRPQLIGEFDSDLSDKQVGSDKSTRYLLNAAREIQPLPKSMQCFLLAAIVETLRKLVVTRFGTNPTWPKTRHRLNGTPERTYKTLCKIVQRRLRDLFQNSLPSDCEAHVLYGDSTEFEPSFKANAIITSPPYLNRLDYVMNYQVENSFLLALQFPIASTISCLRQKMMGTVKVNDAIDPDPAWGTTCNKLLESIRLHPSKAASCYYHNTICHYFYRLHRCVEIFYKVLDRGGVCCLVVQNSYFKNIELPLPLISTEMAQNVGFKGTSFLREDHVHHHIGRTDPDQKRWKQEKLLTEKVVLLER